MPIKMMIHKYELSLNL